MFELFQKKKHKIDLVLMWVWAIMAPFLSWVFDAHYMFSIIIFFIIPSIFLSWRYPRSIKKAALFSLLVGLPLVTALDYIMEATGSMFINQSVFGNFRILDFITIDSYVWGFFFLYLIVIYYDSFLNHHWHHRLYFPAMKYLLILMLLLLATFFFVYFISPATLQITFYFYFLWGFVLVLIPIILLLTKHPKLIAKFFKAGAYFFLLFLGYELTAIRQENWLFPGEGQFIGMVDFFGARFPFEEFFYFIILGAFAAMTWYEFFDDDKK